jgi:hypothetical protein
MLFKNKSFLVKLVKDHQSDEPTVPAGTVDYSDVAADITTGAVVIIVAYKSLDMLSKIAVHAAQTYIR